MSDLAALLPREVHWINHVTLAYSKSVYDDGFDWVVRVVHHDDLRGHALRRYKTGDEAQDAVEELHRYIASVRRLTA